MRVCLTQTSRSLCSLRASEEGPRRGDAPTAAHDGAGEEASGANVRSPASSSTGAGCTSSEHVQAPKPDQENLRQHRLHCPLFRRPREFLSLFRPQHVPFFGIPLVSTSSAAEPGDVLRPASNQNADVPCVANHPKNDPGLHQARNVPPESPRCQHRRKWRWRWRWSKRRRLPNRPPEPQLCNRGQPHEGPRRAEPAELAARRGRR